MTCIQFCMSSTSPRATTAISMEVRKSAAPASPAPAASVSSVVRPSGDATITSDCRNSEYSRTAPLQGGTNSV